MRTRKDPSWFYADPSFLVRSWPWLWSRWPALSAQPMICRRRGNKWVIVAGKIKVTNHGARFDRRMLSALPQHRLATYTEPADSLQALEGPSRAGLLPLIDATGETKSDRRRAGKEGERTWK